MKNGSFFLFFKELQKADDIWQSYYTYFKKNVQRLAKQSGRFRTDFQEEGEE